MPIFEVQVWAEDTSTGERIDMGRTKINAVLASEALIQAADDLFDVRLKGSCMAVPILLSDNGEEE